MSQPVKRKDKELPSASPNRKKSKTENELDSLIDTFDGVLYHYTNHFMFLCIYINL